MNSFVYFTDPHLANRPPEKRIDDYNKSILKKIQWVVNYAKKKKVNGIICGGDLCHTHKTNDELMYKFVEIMASSGLKFYYLYGNHDIQSGNVNYIEKTNMGLLSQYNWFYELDGKKLIEFSDCYLTGINYSHDKECASSFDWQEGKISKEPLSLAFGKKSNKIMILVTHAMITNRQIMISGKVKSQDVNDITTNADILLNGHFHDGHPDVVHNSVLEHDFQIVNPSSLARMNLREAKEGYGPRIAYIKVDRKGAKIKLVDVPCKPIKEIFDVKKQKIEKREKREKDKFIITLSKMNNKTIMGDNFEQALQDVLTKPPKKLRKKINKKTRNILLEKLEKHRGK